MISRVLFFSEIPMYLICISTILESDALTGIDVIILSIIQEVSQVPMNYFPIRIILVLLISGGIYGCGGNRPGLPYVGDRVSFLSSDENNTWVCSWGGTEETSEHVELCSDMALTPDGNLVVVGTFDGSCDFNPGKGTDAGYVSMDKGAFASVFSSSGEFLWKLTWNKEDFYSTADNVALDSDGNIIISGIFGSHFNGGTFDLDPGAGEELIGIDRKATPFEYCYLSKFDPEGKFIWARTWVGIRIDALELNSEGVIHAGGCYPIRSSRYEFTRVNVGFADDEDHRQVLNEKQAMLIIVGPDGEYLGTDEWGAAGDDYLRVIEIDSDDNVFIGGFFMYNVDFDPGEDSSLQSGETGKEFIVKLDSSGAFVWVNVTDTSESKSSPPRGVTSMNADRSGNLYVTGSYNHESYDNYGRLDFTISRDAPFLRKLNSTGREVRYTRLGTFPFDSRVVLDSEGSAYITGGAKREQKLDPEGEGIQFNSVGGTDLFLMKYDAEGDLQWFKSWGSLHHDVGTGIEIGEDGSIFVAGWMKGLIEFGIDGETVELESNGGSDMFLMRVGSDGNF